LELSGAAACDVGGGTLGLDDDGAATEPQTPDRGRARGGAHALNACRLSPGAGPADMSGMFTSLDDRDRVVCDPVTSADRRRSAFGVASLFVLGMQG
jgi:hypothetical protein